MKRNYLFLSLLLTMFLLIGTACSDDNDGPEQQIVGAWQLETITVDGIPQPIGAETAQVINLKQSRVFKRYYTERKITKIGGWSYTADMLNISLDMPAAYYVESVSGTELKLRRLDFNDEGKVAITVNTYKRVAESIIPEK